MTIAKRITTILRDIVFAQDQGVAVAQDLQDAKFELTFIDRLMVAADNQRLIMKHEGFDVYVRDSNSDKAFILGLEQRPHKKPCDHEFYFDGITPLSNPPTFTELCPKCGTRRVVQKYISK